MALVVLLVLVLLGIAEASKEGLQCSFVKDIDLRCNSDPSNCIGALWELPLLTTAPITPRTRHHTHARASAVPQEDANAER